MRLLDLHFRIVKKLKMENYRRDLLFLFYIQVCSGHGLVLVGIWSPGTDGYTHNYIYVTYIM